MSRKRMRSKRTRKKTNEKKENEQKEQKEHDERKNDSTVSLRGVRLHSVIDTAEFCLTPQSKAVFVMASGSF